MDGSKLKINISQGVRHFPLPLPLLLPLPFIESLPREARPFGALSGGATSWRWQRRAAELSCCGSFRVPDHLSVVWSRATDFLDQI
jgi:hypothetical protein